MSRLLFAGIAKFRIWDFAFGGGRRFDFDLPCRGELRGAELREAIAKEMRRRKEELKLLQWRARRKEDGAALAQVRDGSESFFADEEGRRAGNYEAAELHEILDNEKVWEAGPRRLVIGVRKQ